MSEYEKLMMIFADNADKTFVQRVLRPEKFPTLPHEGGIATHRMAWSQLGNQYLAYPTVLYDGEKLVDYGNKALDKVLASGNYIKFDSPQEAQWFSTRYKEAWGGKPNNVPR